MCWLPFRVTVCLLNGLGKWISVAWPTNERNCLILQVVPLLMTSRKRVALGSLSQKWSLSHHQSFKTWLMQTQVLLNPSFLAVCTRFRLQSLASQMSACHKKVTKQFMVTNGSCVQEVHLQKALLADPSSLVLTLRRSATSMSLVRTACRLR